MSLIKIYPENPAERHVRKAVETLRKGGVIIYPTDSVYAYGCDINCRKAVERIAQIKQKKPEKADFSVIFSQLSEIAEYTRPIDNSTFKIMRRNLPGPFTFILQASKKMPSFFMSKKKTIGIRIPDHNIVRAILEELGNPIISSSLHSSDNILEYITDPEEIHDLHGHTVDMVIDGGYGNNVASTVVNCTDSTPEIIRQGVSELRY